MQPLVKTKGQIHTLFIVLFFIFSQMCMGEGENYFWIETKWMARRRRITLDNLFFYLKLGPNYSKSHTLSRIFEFRFIHFLKTDNKCRNIYGVIYFYQMHC